MLLTLILHPAFAKESLIKDCELTLKNKRLNGKCEIIIEKDKKKIVLHECRNFSCVVSDEKNLSYFDSNICGYVTPVPAAAQMKQASNTVPEELDECR